MRFGKLELNPALSPAVLDTATWDPPAAWAAVQAVDDAYWPALVDAAGPTRAAGLGGPLPAAAQLAPCPSSVAWLDETFYCLASLPDRQQIFLEVGPGAGAPGAWELSPAPVGVKGLPANPWGARYLAAHPTDAAVIDRFCRRLAPGRGPRALGPVPRLGIGTRMTTAIWPAIWEAMRRGGFAANAIQNSVREVNVLQTLLDGQPAEKNVAFSFGTIETGYTGSSFEGLWVSGALHALAHHPHGPFGADADHIQVKRGADGLARAKRLLDATRYYSFYTLDVSDVLDYTALLDDPSRPQEKRLAAKYGAALDAVALLYDYIREFKGGVPFDLELSIDEHPNEVPTFECLTSETELIFVLHEAQRRGIPLTHVAPNFGVEKGTDYRGADGLAGFEARCRRLWQIAEDFGVIADFHSGDDLSAATRQAIGRATRGRCHFKVSPNPQLRFGRVLAGRHPDLFLRWWQDALAYARREAAAGSAFAAACIGKTDLASPSAHDEIFHHFSFAFVGRRDANGRFICREEFYDLSPAFYAAYQACIEEYLLELARDLRLGSYEHGPVS